MILGFNRYYRCSLYAACCLLCFLFCASAYAESCNTTQTNAQRRFNSSSLRQVRTLIRNGKLFKETGISKSFEATFRIGAHAARYRYLPVSIFAAHKESSATRNHVYTFQGTGISSSNPEISTLTLVSPRKYRILLRGMSERGRQMRAFEAGNYCQKRKRKGRRNQDTFEQQIESVRKIQTAPVLLKTQALAAGIPTIEIATSADYELVTQFGGAFGANSYIINVLNSVDAIYRRDLGISVKLVDQFAWITQDPVTLEGSDHNAALNRYANFYYFNFRPTLHYDIALLFTGRNYGGSGAAIQNGICHPDYQYGIISTFSYFPTTVFLAAHETGHLIGGQHLNNCGLAADFNFSIMCPGAPRSGDIAKSLYFTAESYYQIHNTLNYLNTVDPKCLMTKEELQTPTPTVTRTATATFTATKTATASSTATATKTPLPTFTGTARPTASPTKTATKTSVPTRTHTASATATKTKTPIGISQTPTPTSFATKTNTPVFTNTSVPTATMTPSLTATATLTATSTFTPTGTATHTATQTATSTFTPTNTATHTASQTATSTFTPTGTATRTASATITATQTASKTPTATITNTQTPTATNTVTAKPTLTATATFTSTASTTPTVRATNTNTAMPTATNTLKPSMTPTATASATPTSTSTLTVTPSATATLTQPNNPELRAIVPILECITVDSNQMHTAYFGYDNLNSAAITLNSPSQQNVLITSDVDTTPPTQFLPGRHYGVFSVRFSNSPVQWTLAANPKVSRSASATDTSPRCKPVIPSVSCISPKSSDISATFGYDNQNSFDLKIEIGDKNYFSPGEASKGQPQLFKAGNHPASFTVIYDLALPIEWTLDSIAVKPKPEDPICNLPDGCVLTYLGSEKQSIVSLHKMIKNNISRLRKMLLNLNSNNPGSILHPQGGKKLELIGGMISSGLSQIPENFINCPNPPSKCNPIDYHSDIEQLAKSFKRQLSLTRRIHARINRSNLSILGKLRHSKAKRFFGSSRKLNAKVLQIVYAMPHDSLECTED